MTLTAKIPKATSVVLAATALALLTGCVTHPSSSTPPQDMPAELRPPRAPAASGPLTLDTPIETICATPAGKAVLDRDLPGLTARPEYAMFKAMSLKQLQPLSRGKITDADLARVKADLAVVKGGGGQK